METREWIEKINGNKSWLFEMINKINKLVTRLTQKKSVQTKSEMKEETLQWHHRNTKDCERQLWTAIHHQIGNLGMDKFLETCNFPNLNHVEIENMKRPIMSKEIKSVKAKTTLSKEKAKSRWFQLWILPIIYGRINASISQTLPEN